MNQWVDILGDVSLAMVAGDSAGAPRFLQARTANDVKTLLGASPAALFQFEDASSTVSTDLVGGSITLTATGGADRVASSIVGNAARIANNTTAQYWVSSGAGDFDVTTGAFAVAGVLTWPSAPAEDSWSFLKYQNASRGWGVSCSTAGHFGFFTFHPDATSATVSSSHLVSSFGFVVGRSVTNMRIYAETTIGSASTVIGSAESLTAAALAAVPGRYQTDAGAGPAVGSVLDGWAFFTGAEAEALLANRAAAVGKLTR